MGNSFFCEQCDIKKYNLSRSCTDQVSSDNKNKLSTEEHWRLKLQCLDDIHSQTYDLTPEAFDELMTKLEKRLQTDSIPFNCKNRDLLIECLGRHSSCMFNCNREMDNFIDCVDTMRMRKIKEKIGENVHK